MKRNIKRGIVVGLQFAAVVWVAMIVAAIVTPPDPRWMRLAAPVVAIFGCASYGLGLWSGRRGEVR